MYLQLKSVLWECLGDLNGKTVLDVGCGDGWLCRELAAAGAQVTGVDGSQKLLDIGRMKDEGIPYLQADLANGLPVGLGLFDRIVSLMVLMDIPELDRLFVDLRQVTKTDGRLVFTILHPGFFQYKVHFDEQAKTWHRRVTNYQDEQIWRLDTFGGHNHYHRNLTYYCELLRRNGFAVTRLYEPEWNPDPNSETAHIYRQWPICLFVEAKPIVA